MSFLTFTFLVALSNHNRVSSSVASHDSGFSNFDTIPGKISIFYTIFHIRGKGFFRKDCCASEIFNVDNTWLK